MAEVIKAGDVAVDATMGNGYDTQFLAHLVGPAGLVYAFDVQGQALDVTRRRLLEAHLLERVELLLVGHEAMREHIAAQHNGRIAAVMFNLGYRPGGDKRLITATGTTLAALTAALGVLADDGRVSIVVYPGHPGGRQEAGAVKQWAESLSPTGYRVTARIADTNHRDSPQWIVVDGIAV